MNPLMKTIKTAHLERRDWKLAVYEFLFSYRHSPHCTTQIAPSTLMFNRQCRYTIPTNMTSAPDDIYHTARRNIIHSKHKSKIYSDNRRNAKDSTLKPGDRVLVKQDRTNKLSTNFKHHPYIITEQKGTMTTATSEITPHTTTRNISHFKRIPQNSTFPFINAEEEEEIHDPVLTPQSDHPPPQPFANQPPTMNNDTPRKQYPKRTIKPVCEWRKY